MELKKANTRTIGLIIGLGVGSGIHYYRHLANASDARGETRRLFLAHADIREVLGCVASANVSELTHYLQSFIEALFAAGCDTAAISAVTPHICISELKRVSPVPIISILDAVCETLENRNLRRVAVFGTRFVIETDLFGYLSNVDVVRPSSIEVDLIDGAYNELALRGHGTREDRDIFTLVALKLCKRERLDAVVLAGTDLSMLFDSEEPDFPSVDCSQVHIKAISEWSP